MIQADVYWIQDLGVRLAILPRPKGDEMLPEDLASLRAQGIDMLISLLTREEMKELGLQEEEAGCRQRGITFHHFPIQDRSTPQEPSSFHELIEEILCALRAGKAVGIHCRAGIGRSSLAAACTMKRLGFDVHESFERISRSRRCRVPDTEEQWEWVCRFT